MKPIASFFVIAALFTLLKAQNRVDESKAASERSIIVGSKIQVIQNRTDRAQWEPMIASDSDNPRNLLACWIDGAQGSNPESFVVVYASFDGGEKWRKTLQIVAPAGIVDPSTSAGGKPVVDPTCAYGQGGVAYATALVPGAPIYRSTDSGRRWAKVLELGIKGWDREFLTVDNVSNQHPGRLYFHYASFTPGLNGGYFWGIDIWRADNSGLRFQSPTKLILNGGPYIGNGTVLSDGTFLAILGEHYDQPVSDNTKPNEKDQIVVVRAGDSTTYSSAVKVSDWKHLIINGNQDTCGPNSALAANTSLSKTKDRLYAVWPDRRHHGRPDITLSVSTDKGKTWSAPRIVNDDDPNEKGNIIGNCTPGIAVNTSGVVGIIWYNIRQDLETSEYHYDTRFTASLDGGETFLPSIKLSDERSFPKKFRIGETIGLAAGPDGKFHALWIENRTGTPQVYYAPITVSRSKIQVSPTPPDKNGQTPQETRPAKNLKDKIYSEEIIPLVLQGGVPDWYGIVKQFENKYGALGRELVWKAKPNYYKRAKDWKNMYASLSAFIGKYGTDGMRPTSLNDYVWLIFENFADKSILKNAARWSLKTVQKDENDVNTPEYADTYANLLYRLGRTKEAIEWEGKAKELARSENDKKRFQAMIDKMRKGEPTWPVK